MNQRKYELYQKRYFQAMFGTEYPERERIEAALDRAHEIRQFEIRLYWQRSLFFWGFVLTLFAGLGLMLTAEKQAILTDIMSVGIALLGFFTTCAWHFIEKGSKAWQANWELHIDCLEDGITGKLYKARLWLGGKKDNFFSVSKITQTVIFVFGIFWFLTTILVILNAFSLKKLGCFLLSIIRSFDAGSCLGVVISILSILGILLCILLSVLLPSLILLPVVLLARREKICFRTCWEKFRLNGDWRGHWRSTDNKKFVETVKFSERARKFEIEE